jgi:site-specific DNA recombinase
VGLLRVSTEDQRLGPEAQRAAIESWAAHEHVKIVAWQQEHVSGGAELGERPGLQAAVASLRAHNAGVLVVAKRDRMARDVRKAQEIAGEDGIVQAAGAVVRSADGLSDAKGPEGVLTMGMVDVVAAYERELIRARTRAAMDVMRRRGEAIGPPPYGYKVGRDGKTLVPHQGEQATIARVVGLYDAGATERGVVGILAGEGALSRAGTPLSQTQVHRILARCRTAGPGLAFERRVQPFELLVDVQLDEVLPAFGRGDVPAPGADPVHWVADAVRERLVALDVVSVKDVLSTGWSSRLQGYSGRGRPQDRLRAFGMLYVESLGALPTLGPKYAAGIADAGAGNGSLYVECGTVQESKVRKAMQAGQKVMVIPYGLGCRIRSQHDTAVLCGRREMPTDSAESLKLIGKIVLGYVFTPQLALRNDQLANDNAM